MVLSGLSPTSSALKLLAILPTTTTTSVPPPSCSSSSSGSASTLNLAEALPSGRRKLSLAAWGGGTPGVSAVAAAAAASSVLGGFGSSKGGAGLLERPKFDQSQFDPLPQIQEGGDIGRIADKKGLGSSDSYRVLLLDDLRHTERLVEKALPQVVPSISAIHARDLFHESRLNGVAVVIIAVKEHAEFYSQMMVRKGLRSAIEPDTST